MARCRVDKSIDRVLIQGFAFPLGVYPIEEMQPRAGYTVTFEPADGRASDGGDAGASGGRASPANGLGRHDDDDDDDDFSAGGLADPDDDGDERGGVESGDWEEWPDRYVFDILVPATRVEALCRALFALLPGRVFPILDVLGQDAFREVDPYVSYDLIGLERFLDGIRRFSGFLYEDGLVGFGVMAEEPFLYIFVDEHKIVTVRVETAFREKVEAVLGAFDLEEVDEIAGADAATHEHRGVLDAPDDRHDLLNAEEIIEYLRDAWRLVLNIDPEKNVDDDGNDLGITGWRCLVRQDWDMPGETPSPSAAPRRTATGVAAAETAGKLARTPPGPDAAPIGRYAEVFLSARCFREAEDLALAEFKNLLPASFRKIWEQDDEAPDVPILIAADRLTTEHFFEEVKRVRSESGEEPGKDAARLNTLKDSRVWHAGWLPSEPPKQS